MHVHSDTLIEAQLISFKWFYHLAMRKCGFAFLQQQKNMIKIKESIL